VCWEEWAAAGTAFAAGSTSKEWHVEDWINTDWINTQIRRQSRQGLRRHRRGRRSLGCRDGVLRTRRRAVALKQVTSDQAALFEQRLVKRIQSGA
jgi:hypothetical protein